VTRRKCPIARNAVGGTGCERLGCECMTGKGSRLCACCLKGHSDLAFTKASNLRQAIGSARHKDAPLARLHVFEDEILSELNLRPTKVSKRSRELTPECWK
jgi:hypothetical protein